MRLRRYSAGELPGELSIDGVTDLDDEPTEDGMSTAPTTLVMPAKRAPKLAANEAEGTAGAR